MRRLFHGELRLLKLENNMSGIFFFKILRKQETDIYSFSCHMGNEHWKVLVAKMLYPSRLRLSRGCDSKRLTKRLDRSSYAKTAR